MSTFQNDLRLQAGMAEQEEKTEKLSQVRFKQKHKFGNLLFFQPCLSLECSGVRAAPTGDQQGPRRED